jgi:hypothetical protein
MLGMTKISDTKIVKYNEQLHKIYDLKVEIANKLKMHNIDILKDIKKDSINSNTTIDEQFEFDLAVSIYIIQTIYMKLDRCVGTRDDKNIMKYITIIVNLNNTNIIENNKFNTKYTLVILKSIKQLFEMYEEAEIEKDFILRIKSWF